MFHAHLKLSILIGYMCSNFFFFFGHIYIYIDILVIHFFFKERIQILIKKDSEIYKLGLVLILLDGDQPKKRGSLDPFYKLYFIRFMYEKLQEREFSPFG